MTSRDIEANRQDFLDAVNKQIHDFDGAALIRRLAAADISIVHYHAILTTLFHQTYSGPYSFAQAGANCPWKHEAIKEYLISHAEEERTHWRWVLDDLRNTNFQGPDPRTQHPHPTCEAYISFNERIAYRMPVARLATASVLEGIGAHFGARYGRQLLDVLDLRKHQATFFLSHAATDIAHTKELSDVIASATLTPEEWGWMSHSATIAGTFYRQMYNHEAFAQVDSNERSCMS